VTIESILSIAPSLPHRISPSRPSPSTPNASHTPIKSPQTDGQTPTSSSYILIYPSPSSERRKAWLRVFSRTTVTIVCVGTAIALPGFGRVMAFLGSFSAFLICIILPVSLTLLHQLHCPSSPITTGPKSFITPLALAPDLIYTYISMALLARSYHIVLTLGTYTIAG
jgi:hypothetical protein